MTYLTSDLISQRLAEHQKLQEMETDSLCAEITLEVEAEILRRKRPKRR